MSGAAGDGRAADAGGQALDLRGKCKEMSEAAVAGDPSLRLVRGWYVDPWWGRQEHWWTVRLDGTIFDPTSGQFPMGGVAEWYEEFRGFYPCQECGVEVLEADLYGGMTCSGECYGRMVGVPISTTPAASSPLSPERPSET